MTQTRICITSPGRALDLSFELPDGAGVICARATVVFERDTGAYCTTGVRFAFHGHGCGPMCLSFC